MIKTKNTCLTAPVRPKSYFMVTVDFEVNTVGKNEKTQPSDKFTQSKKASASLDVSKLSTRNWLANCCWSLRVASSFAVNINADTPYCYCAVPPSSLLLSFFPSYSTLSANSVSASPPPSTWHFNTVCRMVSIRVTISLGSLTYGHSRTKLQLTPPSVRDIVPPRSNCCDGSPYLSERGWGEHTAARQEDAAARCVPRCSVLGKQTLCNADRVRNCR